MIYARINCLPETAWNLGYHTGDVDLDDWLVVAEFDLLSLQSEVAAKCMINDLRATFGPHAAMLISEEHVHGQLAFIIIQPTDDEALAFVRQNANRLSARGWADDQVYQREIAPYVDLHWRDATVVERIELVRKAEADPRYVIQGPCPAELRPVIEAELATS